MRRAASCRSARARSGRRRRSRCRARRFRARTSRWRASRVRSDRSPRRSSASRARSGRHRCETGRPSAEAGPVRPAAWASWSCAGQPDGRRSPPRRRSTRAGSPRCRPAGRSPHAARPPSWRRPRRPRRARGMVSARLTAIRSSRRRRSAAGLGAACATTTGGGERQARSAQPGRDTHEPWRGCWGPGARRVPAYDAEQIDDEDQRRVRWDLRRRAFGPVGERRRDDQLAPTANFHAHDALIPAGDDLALAEHEFERFIAPPGGVKFLAALVEDPHVVDRHRVAGLRFRAGPGDQFLGFEFGRRVGRWGR